MREEGGRPFQGSEVIQAGSDKGLNQGGDRGAEEVTDVKAELTGAGPVCVWGVC